MYDDTRSATTATIQTNNNSNNKPTTFSGCFSTTATATTTQNLSKPKFLHTIDNLSAYRPISVLTPSTKVADPALSTHMLLLTHRRRRFLQRRACLLSIVVAFIIGLVLGVLTPMLSMPQFYADATVAAAANTTGNKVPDLIIHIPLLKTAEKLPTKSKAIINQTQQYSRPQVATRPPSDFPTIHSLQAERDDLKKPTATVEEAPSPYTVAFVREQNLELTAEEVFRNAFHLEQLKDLPNTMLVKKLDTKDGSIKEFEVERLSNGRFRKGTERRLSKPTLTEMLMGNAAGQTKEAAQILAKSQADKRQQQIIKADIFWGDVVERALPQGFNERDAKAWQHYVTNEGKVTQFEIGCGRMQNRLVVFADGTKACARYRQNTDQIQGEIFSFYLGQLLNISNLAPSAATVVDLNSPTWSNALPDIQQAQWKQQRPVVLTRWLPDLEPAGIPQPFQPLERHLNKYDVWNITQNKNNSNNNNIGEQQGLLKRLGASSSSSTKDANSSLKQHNQSASSSSASSLSSSLSSSSSSLGNDNDDVIVATTTTDQPSNAILQHLVELAQWSDLIVFDYLIANLDRVVNNLYNFQWNADIMAAPAHNLARQTDTQLLVFLDNESGLLHGYRLLKKYEAYHGVLLDNLCVFRQPTIDALRQLRQNDPGRMLREIFERTTSNEVRDVLPSLPDKSIKILVDRIDRVLGQVQKCKDLLSNR